MSRGLKLYGLLLLLVQLAGGCSQRAPSQDTAPPDATAAMADAEALAPDTRLVVAFGDSLYAGFNLDPNDGFAPVLQRALEKRGIKAQVVNAGVSGETTGEGRRRLAFTLDGLPRKPDLLILGLGANDMLRGLNPAEPRTNLDAMLAELKKRGVPVMLTGMMASRNLGPEYVAAFDRIYPDLAGKYRVPLYPFFLEGVIGHREMVLPDGLHPSPKGVETVVEGIAPMTAQQLEG